MSFPNDSHGGDPIPIEDVEPVSLIIPDPRFSPQTRRALYETLEAAIAFQPVSAHSAIMADAANRGLFPKREHAVSPMVTQTWATRITAGVRA